MPAIASIPDDFGQPSIQVRPMKGRAKILFRTRLAIRKGARANPLLASIYSSGRRSQPRHRPSPSSLHIEHVENRSLTRYAYMLVARSKESNSGCSQFEQRRFANALAGRRVNRALVGRLIPLSQVQL